MRFVYNYKKDRSKSRSIDANQLSKSRPRAKNELITSFDHSVIVSSISVLIVI